MVNALGFSQDLTKRKLLQSAIEAKSILHSW